MQLWLAVIWNDAIRVSIVGFAGVFVVLTLLYVSTLLYGALARRLEQRAEAREVEQP